MKKIMKLSLIYFTIFSFQFDRAKLTENEPNNQNENPSNTTEKQRGTNISLAKDKI